MVPREVELCSQCNVHISNISNQVRTLTLTLTLSVIQKTNRTLTLTLTLTSTLTLNIMLTQNILNTLMITCSIEEACFAISPNP